MTTTKPRPAAVTGREDTVPSLSGEPIFAALAARWKAEERVVPGEVDREWVRLADGGPWPS
ncbi:hypothetical protein WDA79_02335 [Streptomyces sp. A475]|uniref:hypothetical protein n=1 Tax=Streptomyces sp. A475 TaxID=3131976 RepID=UPI0030CA084E